MPSSHDYWKQREETQRQLNITEEAEYSRRIQDIYHKMYQNIQDDINSFYVKYADKEGITLAEAKRRISKLDMEEYAAKAKRYVEKAAKDRAANGGKTDKTAAYFSEQANAEMRLYNATMKINRLELLKAHLGLEMVDGHDELQKLFGDALTKRAMDEFKRQAGILGDTVQNNERFAHSIVNASFHNAKFSDRVWMAQDLMKYRLNEILTQGLIKGLNPRDLTGRVMPLIKKEIINNKRAAAERLLRTELCRVQIDAQMKSYERNGYDRYIFLAEPTACPHCRKLDDEVFDVKDAMPGENAPPLHPNCRCSTASYAESDEEYEKWFYETTGKHSAQYDLEHGLEQAGERIKFEPAKNLRDAEEYAKKFFDSDFMDKTFKGEADYRGISLKHANEINQTLEEIFGDMDIPKISGIKSISASSKQGKKVFSDSDAIAAYDPIQKGIYINKDILKNDKSFQEYKDKSMEAWDYVMKNIDNLSGPMKDKALIYKNAGRSLVGGNSIRDAITHEMGHHIQWTVLDPKTNNYLGERMSLYAPKISGYANANKSEYFAESFAAYRKGEMKIIDPEYVKFLNSQNHNRFNNTKIIAGINELSMTEIRKLEGYSLLQERLNSSILKKEVNKKKQARHMVGTAKDKQSYLTIDIEKIQELINNEELIVAIHLNDQNRQIKVVIECDEDIGFVYDQLRGEFISTNRATIHYSKTGTHLVPTARRG